MHRGTLAYRRPRPELRVQPAQPRTERARRQPRLHRRPGPHPRRLRGALSRRLGVMRPAVLRALLRVVLAWRALPRRLILDGLADGPARSLQRRPAALVAEEAPVRLFGLVVADDRAGLAAVPVVAGPRHLILRPQVPAADPEQRVQALGAGRRGLIRRPRMDPLGDFADAQPFGVQVPALQEEFVADALRVAHARSGAAGAADLGATFLGDVACTAHAALQ